MNRLKELKALRKLAESLQLDNCQILRKYNMQELCSIYNGIGPDAFPDWLRDVISALHHDPAARVIPCKLVLGDRITVLFESGI